MAWKSAPAGAAAQRPFHAGSASSAIVFGSLSSVELGLVVGKNGGAGGNAGPVAVGRADIRPAPIEVVLRQRREQAGMVDQHHRRRILGEEHVGRGVGAFLEDLVADLEIAALAHGDRNAGLLGEGIGPGLGQVFVLGIVDDDAFVLRLGAACERGGGEKRSGKRERKTVKSNFHDGLRDDVTRALQGR